MSKYRSNKYRVSIYVIVSIEKLYIINIFNCLINKIIKFWIKLKCIK